MVEPRLVWKAAADGNRLRPSMFLWVGTGGKFHATRLFSVKGIEEKELT
jgi:hypothetical protein